MIAGRVHASAVAWLAAGLIVLAGCTPGQIGPGPQTTFAQQGYTVTCRYTGSAINAGGAPSIGVEAESFCRSRAREAVGTLLTTNPGVTIQTVTIANDGSATVCYGDLSKPTCPTVLGAAKP